MRSVDLAPIVILLAAGGLLATAGCTREATPGSGAARQTVLSLPMRTDGPKALDPVRGSTQYDNIASAQIYDTLLQYKYLARPPALEPGLIEAMPEVSADRKTYRFRLRKGVRFHDDPCFPGGKGRELVADDVFYSFKRMADPGNDPKSWWLYEDTMEGFDEFRDAQRERVKNGQPFDYDAAVSGFRKLSSHEFEIVLKRPVYRFMWVLAMFQTSIVPREATEKYGKTFSNHPVGTGPYRMVKWEVAKSLVLERNPTYREEYYPSEHMPEDKALGLDKPAGTRLPIADRIEITMFVEDQPRWLEFQAGNIGYVQVPDEYMDEVFRKQRSGDRLEVQLLSDAKERGVRFHPVPLLDYIFRGFNMEDPILGGYSPEKRALRQAICHAIDWHEFNDTFYSGLCVVYDGPIPPRLDGHPDGHLLPHGYTKLNLDRARQLMVEAGYPAGTGLPVIDYYVARGGNSKEQSELSKRQLSKIGVQLNVRLVDFSTLIEAVNNKKAPLFSFAWGSDYPDGENNLALFYGPNESPGANHFNYKSAAYDALYGRVISMEPSPERTRLYTEMRDMVLTDCPAAGSLARTRYYLIQPWLKNFKPTEDHFAWMKYLDVDESKR